MLFALIHYDMNFIYQFILLIVLFASLGASADLWTVTQQWSPEMEENYQQWLIKNAKVDMFSKEFMDPKTKLIPNPYFGIKTDCADTVYSLRIIFSFENGLPWAMKDPRNPRHLITQATKSYDYEPKDGPEFDRLNELKKEKAQMESWHMTFDSLKQAEFDHVKKLVETKRLKAFLEHLYDLASTSSLANDTYPISVDAIKPGTIILTSHKNHHSWTIVELKKNGNPRLIFNSTIGKQSGSLLQQRISWPNPFWIFEPEEKLSNPNDPNSEKIQIPVFQHGSYAGLRYWIPVDKLKADATTIDGYSEDQFDLELGYWKLDIQRKLAKTKETMQDIVLRLLTDACSDVKQRIDAVEEAARYKSDLSIAFVQELTTSAGTPLSQEMQDLLTEFRKSKSIPTNIQCLTPEKYDQYSTPSRDKRMFDSFMQARAYFAYAVRTKGERSFSATRLAQIKKIFPYPMKSAEEENESQKRPVKVDRNSICQIQIGNKTIDIAEVKRKIFSNQISSNPNEDTDGRWGLRSTPSDLATQCSTYGEVYPPFDLNKAEQQFMEEVKAYDHHMNGFSIFNLFKKEQK